MTSGRVACIGVPGRHRLALSGDTLRFALVADACDGRRNALAQPWVRVRDGEFVLVNVAIIDGTGAAPQSGMTVVVREGRIADLFPTGSRALPAGLTATDLSDASSSPVSSMRTCILRPTRAAPIGVRR
ncbi:MAG TPA: hypothetical protein VK922_12370 [Gemmatimonadaceae bacterium]|nr:hypothetical protein [Gemmatimonadaceae bacterium]